MKTRMLNRTGTLVPAIALLACFAGTAMATPPATIQLTGVVRDFSPSHPDFGNGLADSLSMSAGNVASSLDLHGLPSYTGSGTLITTSARDRNGNTIAPGMAAPGPVTNFNISGGSVTSTQPMAAKITVIGAAISAGTYDCMVTMQVHAGTLLFSPFGLITGAVTGNVNDNNNPRSYVMPAMISPGSAITVDGRSWTRKVASNASLRDTDWQALMTVNSATGGVQVKALRNGDSAPNTAGFAGQVSAKAMLTHYINTTTNKITLASNQVIYLFELGTTSTTSSAFDMQDLVVLVDLATDPSYFTGPAVTTPTCGSVADSGAVRGGGDLGGIASASSFSMWFDDRSGYNLSAGYPITLTRDSAGVYTYSTSDFHPIDGQLYGNPSNSHNRGFTYAINATFSYCGCTGQFFEYTGDGDAWLFVNGKLVMDMGGTHAGAKQYVDMDRLGLVNGETARVQLFMAQRSDSKAAMTIRTNIAMETRSINMPAVSGLHD